MPYPATQPASTSSRSAACCIDDTPTHEPRVGPRIENVRAPSTSDEASEIACRLAAERPIEIVPLLVADFSVTATRIRTGHGRGCGGGRQPSSRLFVTIAPVFGPGPRESSALARVRSAHVIARRRPAPGWRPPQHQGGPQRSDGRCRVRRGARRDWIVEPRTLEVRRPTADTSTRPFSRCRQARSDSTGRTGERAQAERPTPKHTPRDCSRE
jgi:hypothetical protein